jgi:hypothetical protein
MLAAVLPTGISPVRLLLAVYRPSISGAQIPASTCKDLAARRSKRSQDLLNLLTCPPTPSFDIGTALTLWLLAGFFCCKLP